MDTIIVLALIAITLGLQVIILRFALSIPRRLKLQEAQLKLQVLIAEKAGIEKGNIKKALGGVIDGENPKTAIIDRV